jgi:hypothetical protein
MRHPARNWRGTKGENARMEGDAEIFELSTAKVILAFLPEVVP